MTKGAEQNAQAAPLLDRSDERVKHAARLQQRGSEKKRPSANSGA